MRYLANSLFWFTVLALLFCGLYFVASNVANFIIGMAPNWRVLLRLAVWAFSIVMAPVLIVLIMLFFGKRG